MTLETSPFRSSLQRASVESTRTPHESLISPLILNLNLTCDRNNTTVSLQENMNLLYNRKSIKNPKLIQEFVLFLIQEIIEKASQFQSGEEILRFAPSLTITILNILLPQIFNILAKFEDWSSAFEVNITLYR